jgi:hypothetical protein
VIRRLVLLAGLWAAAVLPATGTPIGLPPAPCLCDWVLVNDPTDDPIQTAAEIAADAIHEGDPSYVLVCPAGPLLPPVPSPFGIPPLGIPPAPGAPVPFGVPPVDPPPTATGEAGTGILLILAWVWTWRKARR